MDALSGIKRATSLCSHLDEIIKINQKTKQKTGSLAVFISFAFCEERGNQRRAVAQMPSNHRHPSKKKKEKISSSFFVCVCG
jgi:hypothetical protein